MWSSVIHGCRLSATKLLWLPCLEQTTTPRHVCTICANFLPLSEDSSVQPFFSRLSVVLLKWLLSLSDTWIPAFVTYFRMLCPGRMLKTFLFACHWHIELSWQFMLMMHCTNLRRHRHTVAALSFAATDFWCDRLRSSRCLPCLRCWTVGLCRHRFPTCASPHLVCLRQCWTTDVIRTTGPRLLRAYRSNRLGCRRRGCPEVDHRHVWIGILRATTTDLLRRSTLRRRLVERMSRPHPAAGAMWCHRLSWSTEDRLMLPVRGQSSAFLRPMSEVCLGVSVVIAVDLFS